MINLFKAIGQKGNLTDGGLVSNSDVVQTDAVNLVDTDEATQLLVSWSKGP